MTDQVAAELVDDRIVLKAEFRDKDLAKSIPGHLWDGDAGMWHYPRSWATCKALRAVFDGRLAVGPELAAWAAWEWSSRIQPALDVRHATDVVMPGYEQLRPYQRVGVALMSVAKMALNADDMGTGKTVQTIMTLKRLVECGFNPYPALIVTPAGVKTQWVREFEKWWPDGPRFEAVTGNVTQRRKILERLAEGELDGAVINWENLRNHSRLAPYGSVRLRHCEVCDPEGAPGKRQASCHRCPKELNEIEFKFVAADEIHRARDATTAQTRALWALMHQPTVEFRYGLTGTPIDSEVSELWPIMHAIAPHEFPRKTDFVDRYAQLSWNAYGGMEIIGIRPEHRDEFFSFFDPRFIRRPKEAVLAFLPEKTRVTRECTMGAKQAKMYRQLAEEMIARLDDGETVAAFNSLTLTGRLNQAAASYLEATPCETCDRSGVNPRFHPPEPHPDPAYAQAWCWCAQELEDPKVHGEKCLDCGGHGVTYTPTTPSCKIDELLEVLDELGDTQAVVFAVSRKLIELASHKLDQKDVSHELITGAIPQHVREVNVGKFARGETRLILATIDAAGEGLDGLQVADTAIYLQRHYSRIKNDQSEDRIHRMGQESDKCVIIDLMTRDTIEWDKEVQLAQKEGRFQELVRDEEALRRLLSGDLVAPVEEA